MIGETVLWQPKWTIYKHKGGAPISPESLIETEVIEGNMLLDGGANIIWQLVSNVAGTVPFDSANACIGVGDSTAVVTGTQAGLQAPINKLYKRVEPAYPTVNGRTIIFRTAFYEQEANFAWKEFCVANGLGEYGTVVLNRKVDTATLRQKGGDIWVLQLEITLQSAL